MELLKKFLIIFFSENNDNYFLFIKISYTKHGCSVNLDLPKKNLP